MLLLMQTSVDNLLDTESVNPSLTFIMVEKT